MTTTTPMTRMVTPRMKTTMGMAREDGEEGEGEPDPHLVLDPNFVMRYAKVVLDSLIGP